MGLFSRRKAQEQKGIEIEEGWPTGAPSGFLVFDVETTGLSPVSNRILEIGMVRVDPSGKPLGYWSSLVNPQGPVGATHVHGIKEADVANAPTFEEIVGDILSKLHGQVLVAHNASFDRSFLHAELGRVGWSLPDIPVVCTMAESKNFLPGLDRRRLSDCAEAIGIRQDVEHRALGDASLATAILHFYLNGPVNTSRSAQLSLLPSQAAGILWPTEPGDRITPKASQRTSRRTVTSARLELLESVSEVLPEDLLGDSPSTPELSYASLLLSSLDDGVISDSELLGLSECADIFGLGSDFVNDVHEVQDAWHDGLAVCKQIRSMKSLRKAALYTSKEFLKPEDMRPRERRYRPGRGLLRETPIRLIGTLEEIEAEFDHITGTKRNLTQWQSAHPFSRGGYTWDVPI